LITQQASPTPGRMARRKKYVQEMVARFLAGTFERIEAVLRPDEDRADLVRAAVEAEVSRRERAVRRAGETSPPPGDGPTHKRRGGGE
jgi:hypothetical protein